MTKREKARALTALLKHKAILRNIGYLTLLEGVNLLIPLITLPYLLRILGGETYGRIIFCQAIVNYLVILVSFGFNITAVAEVSIHRNNKEKISEIVSNVFLIKGVLFVFSFFIVYALLSLFPVLAENKALLYLTMWLCLYEFIFPQWYFQGIEKMGFVTIITSVFRFLFLVLIFLFVNRQSDFLLVPIINGIGVIIAGGIGLYIVFVKHGVKLRIYNISKIKYYLKESFPVFIYKSSQLYIKLNKVIIGAFLGMKEVAFYDLAEKIVAVLKMPLGIIGQAVFPKNVKDKNIGFITRVFTIIIGISAILILSVIAFSSSIVKILGGVEMISAAPIVNLLVFTLIPISFNSLLASQTLLAFGHKKEYMWSILYAGLTYFTLVIVFYGFGFWTLLGVGSAVLLAECVTAFSSLYYIKRLKIIK